MKQQLKKLYVIGNGFDIHHKIKSKYSEYAKWLWDEYPKYAEHLDDVYGDCDSDWWKDFENNLASLQAIKYSSKVAAQNQPDLASDHCDRTWENASYAVKSELDELYSDIRESFHNWVLGLNAPQESRRLLLNREDAVFLTFNYTKTLEDMYGVSPNNILHIHGCIDCDENFILGHGKSKSELEEINRIAEPQVPENLSDEELAEWYEEREDQGLELHEGYALDSALNEISSQRKPVEDIIAKNKSFFESIGHVEEVFFFGISFSEVDMPYFKEIVKSATHAKYYLSCYSEEDKMAANQFVEELGIKSYQLVKLDDFLDKRQLALDFND